MHPEKVPFEEWAHFVRAHVQLNPAPFDPALLRPFTRTSNHTKIVDLSHVPDTLGAWMERLLHRKNKRVVVLVALTPASEELIFQINYALYADDPRTNCIVFNDVFLVSPMRLSRFNKRHVATPEDMARRIRVHCCDEATECALCGDSNASMLECGTCKQLTCAPCGEAWYQEKGIKVSCPFCRTKPKTFP